MATTSQQYYLSPDDMAEWISLLAVQNVLGLGRPPIDDGGAWTLISWINTITLQPPSYNRISNPQLKAWIDGLFDDFIRFKTSYDNRTFPEVYVAYTFASYINLGKLGDCFTTFDKYFQGFATGLPPDPVKYKSCFTSQIGPWTRPGVPASWSEAINQAFANWGATGNLSGLGITGGDTLTTGLRLFSPARWTNAQVMKGATVMLWVTQQLAKNKLHDLGALDDDSCVFLLYLLCSLATGPAETQQMVQNITGYPTSSIELPNDTFIDHLVYYVMMLWIDPLGKYGFSSDQVKSALNSLNAALMNGDAGTQAIKTAVCKNLKVLNAASTFPMNDPYNPNIGFNSRKSDTLEALNSTWMGR